MNRFDSSLGTLTGATIYFYGAENVTDFTLLNPTNSNRTFGWLEKSDFTVTNTADTHDPHVWGGDPPSLHIFDTGGFIDSLVPTFDPIALAPGTSVSYLGFTIQNIDPIYGNDIGTGAGGVTGVKNTISASNLYHYLDTAGPSFALSGRTNTSIEILGDGNLIDRTLNSAITLQAEIDYTYTPFAAPPPPPPSTLEPATLVLMGTALAGAGLMRKRIRG